MPLIAPARRAARLGTDATTADQDAYNELARRLTGTAKDLAQKYHLRFFLHFDDLLCVALSALPDVVKYHKRSRGGVNNLFAHAAAHRLGRYCHKFGFRNDLEYDESEHADAYHLKTPQCPAEVADANEYIRSVIAALPPLTRQIVQRRHGLHGKPSQPIAEIARCLKLPRDKTSLLYQQGLAVLKEALASLR